MAPSTIQTKSRHIEGLPLSVVGPIDLGRLIRELASIENSLVEARLRNPGAEIKMPKTGKIMDEVLSLNNLDLLKDEDRKALKLFLNTVRAKAPRLHISFSADPSTAFITKIMIWLRDQIHPVVLVNIGLEPGIGAGCVVRTANKYFDFSLRKDFAKNRDLVMASLHDSAPLKVSEPVLPTQATMPAQPVAAMPPATATAAAPIAQPAAPHAAQVHARQRVPAPTPRPATQTAAPGVST